MEYFFIAITTRFTLTQRDCSSSDSMCKMNLFKLFVFARPYVKTKKNLLRNNSNMNIYELAHLAGFVEYAHCISEVDQTGDFDMTLNNLMVKLQSWSFGKCGLPLYCYCFPVLSDPDWLHLIKSYLFYFM